MRIPKKIGWFAAVLVCFACAPVPRVQPVRPEVNLLDLRVADLTLSHANLIAELRVFNPNRVAMAVEGITYQLFLNEVPISDGETVRGVQVAAGEYGTMDLRFSIPYLSLLRLAAGLRPEEKIRLAMNGGIRVGGARLTEATFPFKWDGAFTVRELLTLPGR